MLFSIMEKYNFPSGTILSKPKKAKLHFSLNLPIILMACFFATWGEGTNIGNWRFSHFYPVLTTISLIVLFLSRIANKLLFGRKLLTDINRPVLYFAVYSVLHSVVYAVLQPHSIIGLKEGYETISGYTKYIDEPAYYSILRFYTYVLPFFAVSTILKNERQLRFATTSLAFGLICSLVVSHLFMAGEFQRLYGGPGGPNILACSVKDILWLILVSLFVTGHISRFTHYRLLSLGIILFVIILLTVSRGQIMALFLGLLAIVAIMNVKKKVIFLTSISILIGIILLGTELLDPFFQRMGLLLVDRGTWRLDIFRYFLSEMDFQTLLFGNGLNYQPDLYMRGHYSHIFPHNNFLVTILWFGIPGLLLYLYIFYSLAKTSFKFRNTTQGSILLGAIVSTIISALVIQSISIRTHWILFAFLTIYNRIQSQYYKKQ